MAFSFVALQVVLFLIAFWSIVLGALLVTERIIFNRIVQKSQVDLKLPGTAYSVINTMAIGAYVSFAVLLIAGALAVPSLKRSYDSSIFSAMSRAGQISSAAVASTRRSNVPPAPSDISEAEPSRSVPVDSDQPSNVPLAPSTRSEPDSSPPPPADSAQPSTVPPKTIYAPDNYKTIREALNAANDRDTIVVRSGTYTGKDNKNLDFAGKAITLRSEKGPQKCIIDCENDGRGFYFHHGEASFSVVDGFTIRNASVAGPRMKGWGGAIFCSDGVAPIISNCVVSNNKASWCGAGISCYNGSSPVIKNCTISGNTSAWGSGISLEYGCSPIVENCTFSDNTGSSGYVIYCGKQCSPKITNCKFVRSSKEAIYLDLSASPTITNCTYE